MKTLEATQTVLQERRGLALVDMVRLRTFTDRDAGTVQTISYFSTRWFRYDYGNTGTDVQVQPFLVRISEELSEMDHIPAQDGTDEALRRRITIVLRNGLDDTPQRLYKTLRALNLELAEIEWSQLFLDTSKGEGPPDLRALTGAEHTVRFRGHVQRVARVDDGEIELIGETRLPQIPWIIASDATINDPLDVGRRLPIVYGAMNRVPAVGWTVGTSTILASVAAITDTVINLTEASAVPSSGAGRLGGDRLTWTGKTADQLTGVVWEAGSIAHAAGEPFLEEVASTVFVLNGAALSAVRDLYVRNVLNDELMKVTTAFTTTLANTTLISGKTVTTVSFDAEQMRALLDAMAEQYVVSQQAQFGTSAASQTITGQCPNQGLSDGRDFNPVSLLTAGAHSYFFQAPPGPITSQTIRVYYVAGTYTAAVSVGSGTLIGSIVNPAFDGERAYSTSIDTNAVAVQSVSGPAVYAYVVRDVTYIGPALTATVQSPTNVTGANGALTFDGSTATGATVTAGSSRQINFPPKPAGTFYFQKLRVYGQGRPVLDYGYAGIINAGSVTATLGQYEVDTPHNADAGFIGSIGVSSDIREIQRVVYTDAGSTISRTQDTLIAGSQYGFGLRFFADCDGPVASGGNYSVSNGTLLQAAADIIRHIVADLCGSGHTVIEAASFTTSVTNLGATVHAAVLNDLGFELGEILSRVAFDARSNLLIEERASASSYRLLQALSTYAFGATVRTLDDFASVTEEARDAPSIFTRFRFLYGWDPSLGDVDDPEAYRAVVRIDEDQNDVAVPSTATVSAAEARYGRRDAPVVLFPTIQVEATAEERAGYYAVEWMRVAARRTVRDVPWTLAYDLERGEVVTLTPPWDTVSAKHRVLGVSKDPNEMCELVLAEVV